MEMPFQNKSQAGPELTQLLEENQRLRREKQSLELQINDIIHSKSWKVTEPLRQATLLKNWLLPFWSSRTFTFSLKPEKHIWTDGREFQPKGSNPILLMDSESGDYPARWAIIEASVQSNKDQLFFYLYPKEGDGFSEKERVLVSFIANGSVQRHLVKLPLKVKGLRLDPFDTEAAFSMSGVTMRELGSLQLQGALFNKYIRPYVTQPQVLQGKLKKAWQVYREGGLAGLRVRLFADSFTSNYQEWVKRYDTLNDSDRQSIRDMVDRLSNKPLISVLMPTYNTPEPYLRAAIESVRKQLYPNWELCIADDASQDPKVRVVIQEYAALDPRIKFVIREKNGHISEASNSALALATGSYVALLDHDDELSEHALAVVADEINRHPGVGLFYSDEDKLTGYGLRFNPYFKSDWNPELFLSQNYLCHLCVYVTAKVKEVGGFRKGFEGAQDWDLALRVSEALGSENIRHIPHVLYHWRVIEGSTAQSTAHKPYVLEAQKKAVEEHLERRGIQSASVQILHDISHLRVTFPVPVEQPLVSIIIPTRNKKDLVKLCVESIHKKTEYKNFEILLVDNQSDEQESVDCFKDLEARELIKIVPHNEVFNFSRINNVATKVARGSILGFLNNDLEVISPHWLSEMVSLTLRNDVGAVGARLLYPNNLVQHAGIILGIGGVAGHNHRGVAKHDPGYFNRSILRQNLSAVTAACLLMRREVFEKIEGFDEDLSVAFNDVDLCLRIREKGYQVVYTPYAELYHYESASRGYETTPEKFMRFEGEIARMKKRWSEKLRLDPYYNPNLTLLGEDFSFAFPPRVDKPWRRHT